MQIQSPAANKWSVYKALNYYLLELYSESDRFSIDFCDTFGEVTALLPDYYCIQLLSNVLGH